MILSSKLSYGLTRNGFEQVWYTDKEDYKSIFTVVDAPIWLNNTDFFKIFEKFAPESGLRKETLSFKDVNLRIFKKTLNSDLTDLEKFIVLTSMLYTKITPSLNSIKKWIYTAPKINLYNAEELSLFLAPWSTRDSYYDFSNSDDPYLKFKELYFLSLIVYYPHKSIKELKVLIKNGIPFHKTEYNNIMEISNNNLDLLNSKKYDNMKYHDLLTYCNHYNTPLRYKVNIDYSDTSKNNSINLTNYYYNNFKNNKKVLSLIPSIYDNTSIDSTIINLLMLTGNDYDEITTKHILSSDFYKKISKELLKNNTFIDFLLKSEIIAYIFEEYGVKKAYEYYVFISNLVGDNDYYNASHFIVLENKLSGIDVEKYYAEFFSTKYSMIDYGLREFLIEKSKYTIAKNK